MISFGVVNSGSLGFDDRDRRVLVGDAIGRHPGRERTVLRLVELELVVLDDQRPAVAHVVEQPAVVRAQIGAALVGAHAGDDDVEARQIAPGEIVRRDQLDLRAELRDGRRHVVADAHDVADRQIRARLCTSMTFTVVSAAAIDVLPSDVRILDHLDSRAAYVLFVQ